MYKKELSSVHNPCILPTIHVPMLDLFLWKKHINVFIFNLEEKIFVDVNKEIVSQQSYDY